MAGHIEEHLDTTLREVIPIVQDEVTQRTTWFGVRALKNPLDAWVYQEILHETRPDVVVEIGTMFGGSTLYLAHLLDLMDHGRIISMDLSHAQVPDVVKRHPRITFVEGDAFANFAAVEKIIGKEERVLVIEDSSHTCDNTLALLRLYSTLVKPGDYFIVEDSICHHGLDQGPKPGPWEALETFAAENPDFETDRTRERFLLTWNPKGYLRRTKLTVTTDPSRCPPPPAPEPEPTPPPPDPTPFPAPEPLRPSPFRETVKLFLPPIVLKLYRKVRPHR